MINAISIYRLAHYLYLKKIPILPKILKLIIFIFYNSSIPFEAKIGKGTFLGYGGISVIIHKHAIIGDNVNIGAHVVIGGRSDLEEVPMIKNNVLIGAGAKILGNVIIENNVKIGANAVVITNVPEGCTAVGIPAKIIKNA